MSDIDKMKAFANDVETMISIGDLILNSEETLSGYSEALVWYEKAAEQGNLDGAGKAACTHYDIAIALLGAGQKGEAFNHLKRSASLALQSTKHSVRAFSELGWKVAADAVYHMSFINYISGNLREAEECLSLGEKNERFNVLRCLCWLNAQKSLKETQLAMDILANICYGENDYVKPEQLGKASRFEQLIYSSAIQTLCQLVNSGSVPTIEEQGVDRQWFTNHITQLAYQTLTDGVAKKGVLNS